MCGGFSFIVDIFEVAEPKHFKAASTINQWKNAMQKEFDALKA